MNLNGGFRFPHFAYSAFFNIARQPENTHKSGTTMIDLSPTLELPSSTETACDRWLTNLDRSMPVSSNQPSIDVPFQRWFKFKEAFAPQFIIDCIRSMDTAPRTCLDPFGGSGTTALTCQFLDVSPTTIEVNPFLADLISAKLASYDLQSLRRDYLSVLENARKSKKNSTASLRHGPETLIAPGKDGRWIFSESAADMILRIREAIAALRSEKNRTLLRSVLGSILVQTSNVVVNGKGRKYRRGWELRQKHAIDVDTAFRNSFLTVYSDLARFATRPKAEFRLLRGDSRRLISRSDPVDCVIFSPPYPNSFDYTDIYNLELWMLGYLRSREDNTTLRNQTVRSHVQVNRDWSAAEMASVELQRTYERLCRKRDQLWSSNIPEMVLAYFDDMQGILRAVKQKLRPKGRAFLAVGNSKYAGVMIDTATILREMAPSVGFKCCRSTSIRSMRSSAQQGGRAELSESLLVFS